MTPDAPRDSLRWRLPLLIALVLAGAIVIFAAAAYWRMQDVLLRAEATRAQGAATQLASLLTQSVTTGGQQVARVSALPAVDAFMKDPGPETEAAARRALDGVTPRPTGKQTIEIWSADRRLLLKVARGDGHAGGEDASAPPAGPGAQPLREANGVLLLELAGPIAASPGALMVARGELTNRASVEAIQRMVGGGAVVRIGTPGHAWTDLVHIVEAPPTEAAGITTPQAARDAGAVVANVPVASTPWMASIAEPLDVVLAPARTLIGAFAVAGLIVVAGAALVGFVLTGRITRPLGELSDAAGSIAAGDYSRRVQVTRSDEIGRLAGAFNTMSSTVEEMHERLESRVEERTRELEAFSYSVSHDLRAPLRHIAGFASLLERTSAERLDAEGKRHLRTISEAAAKMGRLIDDLLSFSRTGRAPLDARAVPLGPLVEDARREVASHVPDRRIEWHIGPLPEVWGDPALLRLALVNVLSNAVKYTAPRDVARIDISAERDGPDVILRVADNGVGFDPIYASKLFGVFQRLHHASEFEGTGIGLANVRQIVNRHGGRVWADGAVNAGAVFHLALPMSARVAAGAAPEVELT